MGKVLLALLAVPFIELWVLIAVGSDIGAFSTILLCFVTAGLGMFFLRLQSFSLLRQADEKVARGEPPAQEMVEGVVMAIGGAFLLFPGFITDFLGFLFILPLTRTFFVKSMMKNYGKKASFYASSHESVVVDVEFEDVTDKDDKKLK